MSEFLKAICQQCEEHPEREAFLNSDGERLAYGELGKKSDRLASVLADMADSKNPVVLLGHKQPEMIVGMLACMKAGLAYVPLDASLPAKRVLGVIDQLESPIIVEVGPGELLRIGYDASVDDAYVITREALEATVADEGIHVDGLIGISGNDAHYIIFTSGSTGTPKGVVLPASAADSTYMYFSRFLPEYASEHQVTMFNRAHYSFDLSIFDLFIALPFGHRLFALTGEAENSMAAAFETLGNADIDVWVSTPSYLNMCLVDPSFSPSLLPQLGMFVVCGETLHNSTALKLLDRFPCSTLYNTYGPTETQGAITDVVITRDVAACPEALPVGTVSPYNDILIIDRETGSSLSAGKAGEVVILGNTVASGYYGRPDLTEAAFGERETTDGAKVRYYKTGDEGYLDENGMLHFLGRYDGQVKVNGYRIELGEIEETLNRMDGVLASCVVPVQRQGVNSALAAHVVLKDRSLEGRAKTKELKERLKETLPSYMIPRTITYHSELPVNANGKIDRKALAAEG